VVQTETVTRQALEEYVRPVLFVNKIDRLIKELKLNGNEIEHKLLNIIRDFNKLIDLYAPSEFRDQWRIDPFEGSVALGSAKDRWGITLDIAAKQGLKFSDIVSAYQGGSPEELSKRFPVHASILDMVVEHFPSPEVAQKYRVPKLWRGDLDSDVGKAMISCDPNGPTVFVASHMRVDPQAGVVATGRLFSGTVMSGQEVYLLNSGDKGRIQQVGLYMGLHREIVGSLGAGNIPAILGLSNARAGETISSLQGLVPFEGIKYVSEPVMTLAVEPKHPRDLPELVNVMKRLSIEDPNLKIHIDEQTGEYLLSGMGQLHLEVALTFIKEAGLDVASSNPIVIYRETVLGKGGPVATRSPNGHNKVSIEAEPLEPTILQMIAQGKISEFMESKERARLLREAGWDPDDAKNLLSISESMSVFVDATKGVQRLEQVSGSIRIGFTEAMTEGVLAREPVRGLKVRLMDATIHEDPAHHGPGQMIPAVKRGLYAAMLLGKTAMLEPILRIDARVPMEQVGTVTRIINQLRGKVSSVDQKGHLAYVVGEIPAAESFGLSDTMRSSTSGRAFWDTSFLRWDTVPASISPTVVAAIRARKGLPPEIPKVSDFLE